MNPKAVSRVFLIAFVLMTGVSSCAAGSDLHLTQQEVLERQGLSVLLFHNSYHRVFGDQKMSGMEIILHDQRIATNGDVRLSATPAQWDAIPEFKERKRGRRKTKSRRIARIRIKASDIASTCARKREDFE